MASINRSVCERTGGSEEDADTLVHAIVENDRARIAERALLGRDVEIVKHHTGTKVDQSVAVHVVGRDLCKVTEDLKGMAEKAGEFLKETPDDSDNLPEHIHAFRKEFKEATKTYIDVYYDNGKLRNSH